MAPPPEPGPGALARPGSAPAAVTVVAIAGPVALFFDDYAASSVYPEDVTAWARAGADPDAWRTPRLAADLRALRAGTAIVPPTVGARSTEAVGPARYVVLEEPFGRARRELRDAIDVVAVLELPLAVALARRVRRQLAGVSAAAAEEARAGALRGLDGYLAWYLDGRGWEAYAAGQRAALVRADLVLDGTRPVDDLAAEVVRRVARHTVPPPPWPASPDVW